MPAKYDLENPDFVRWLHGRLGGVKVEPEDRDLPPTTNPGTPAYEAAYQLAQARKLLRLYEEWRASRPKKTRKRKGSDA